MVIGCAKHEDTEQGGKWNQDHREKLCLDSFLVVWGMQVADSYNLRYFRIKLETEGFTLHDSLTLGIEYATPMLLARVGSEH